MMPHCKIIKKQLTKEQKDQICQEVKGGINKELKVSIMCLFNKDFLKTTILLIFIWYINAYICYGGNFTLQQTLSKLSKSSSTMKPTQVIISQIVVNVITLPGNFLSGWFSEMKFFGRIYSTVFFYVLGAIFLGIACIFTNEFDILFGFSNLCTGAAFNISSAYTSEIYPTVIRDTALGFFYFCTRISGFASQFLATGLENTMLLLQYYVMIITCVIGAIIICFIPIDSYGIPIDLPIVVNDGLTTKYPEIKKC